MKKLFLMLFLLALCLGVTANATAAGGDSGGYSVAFSYDQLEYVLPGDASVALNEILDAVGLSGAVRDVTFSSPDLLSLTLENNEWYVRALKPFSTTEWMKVNLSGAEYEITVTDDQTITVYFVDAQGWGSANIYYWNDGPDWPGAVMTPDGTQDNATRYKATIPAGVMGIIFNGNGNQSVDITENISNGATWYTTGEMEYGNYKVALSSGSGGGGGSGEGGNTGEGGNGSGSDYYLVGSMSDWSVNSAYKLARREASETEEYVLSGVSLNANDAFKIVSSADGIYPDNWYPDGTGNNYGENGEITAAGTYDVYFRPNYDGGEDWFYGCIYVTEHADISTLNLVVTPEAAGTITEVIPAPMPTDAAYDNDSPPAHAFAVEAGEGYEVDNVVYKFDNDTAQSLTYASGEAADGTYGKFWYIKESSIPAGGYNSLTVTASFAQAYAITVPEGIFAFFDTYGDGHYAKPGKTIGLQFNINNVPVGCATDKLIVTPEGGQPTEVSMTKYSDNFYRGTFTMPAAAVSVAYAPIDYSIHTSVSGSGEITPGVNGSFANAAQYNAPVTLTVEAADGYELSSLTYVEDGSETPVNIENNQFSMPAADVTVSAVFTPIEYSITYNLGDGAENGWGNPDSYTVESYYIYLNEPTRDGYGFMGWTGTGLDEPTMNVVIESGSTGDREYTATWVELQDFSTCKATVPGQTLDNYSYIYYKFENANYGYETIGETVMDGETTLTLGVDYEFSDVVFADGSEGMPEHVGDVCLVEIRGKGAYGGVIYAEFMIVPPTDNGTLGSMTWSFSGGVLSVSGTGEIPAQNSFQDYPWYQYSRFITDIVIDEGITSVPYAAFGGSNNVNPYTNVKTVTLPTTLTDIGECAFAYCSLETINLDYVETIESQAFNQCGNLDIVVPAMAKHTDDTADTMKSVNEFAFEACGKVTFAIVIGDTENGTVTATVNDSAVEAAAWNAAVTLTVVPAEGFELESLTYAPANGEAEEITEITADAETGAYAFTMPRMPVIVSAVFTRLLPEFGTPNFTLPADTTTIGESAFEGVDEMEIVDASNVTSIGANAFRDCTELKQIRLPMDCAIEDAAFDDQTIYVFAPAGGDTEAYCDDHENLIFVEEEEAQILE